MLHAVLIFAATEGGAEPSKTAFYLIGGVLAGFAVALGALGIVRHDFPSSTGAARGVMALAAVLVLATMASAVLTS